MITETKRPLKVFLSYASQDRFAVRELYERLKAEGWIEPWLDQENLTFGQHWTTVIQDALDETDAVIIFLSRNSVQKEGFIQRELRHAWDVSLEKPHDVIFLIPLRLDECDVPRYLSSRHWGDYFGAKKESSYQILLRSLRQRYQQKLQLEADERERAEELARQEAERKAKEEAEREAAEKAAREKAERKAAEQAAREKTEREAAEQAAKEEAEREAAEKAARKKQEKEIAEQKKREEEAARLERREAIRASAAKFIDFFKAVVFSKGFLVAGIMALLLWGASSIIPNLSNPTPTVKPDITVTFAPTTRPTSIKTSTPIPSKTKTPTPTLTPVLQSSILLQEDFEDNSVSSDWATNWVIKKDTKGNHYWLAEGTGEMYPSAWYFADGTDDWKDYAFEIRVKFVNTSNIFMGSHAYPKGVSSFFVTWVTYDGLVNLVEYNDPEFGWRVIEGTDEKTSITRNKWYLLRFEVKDNKLATYIDNKLITETNIPQPVASNSGTVGFYIGQDHIVHIDDIRVWSLK